MKKLLIITLILFTHSSLSANTINWVLVKDSFKKYTNYPTDKTAQLVLNLLPKDYINLRSKESLAASEFIYNYRQFGMLRRQIISKHRLSIRIAFRLRMFADGAFLEDLYIELGKLIRINPELFLSELLKAKLETNQIKNFLNLGDTFVDRPKATCYEINMRLNSLNRVSEPGLSKTKSKISSIFFKELSSPNCIKYNNTP